MFIWVIYPRKGFNMRKILLALIITAVMSGMTFAQDDGSYNKNYATTVNLTNNVNNSAIKEGVITVPAGESFRCVFMSPISSETAYGGEEITLAVANDFYYNNILVAPAGSTVTGAVIEVSKAKHGSVSGKLTLRFTHIITPAGYDIPISAIIKTSDGSGTLIGGQNVGFITSEIPAASESVGIKGYVPPYLGVRSGTGAAMTTAVETGGGGLLKSIWDKGDEVEISVNTRLDIILTQPITIIPSEPQNK